MSSERKFYVLIILLLLAGYAWTAYALLHDQGPSIQVCVVKQLSGVPCPSCGSTRSVVSLLNGDLLQGLYLNPLGLVLLAAMMLIPVLLLVDLFNKRLTLYHLYLKSIRLISNKRVAWMLVLLVLLNWIWNIQKEI